MGRSGLNMVKAGRQNRAVILQTISDEGAVSRKRIAEITGLTPAGITLITNELLSEGLIREGEKVSPDHKAGRRQVLLELCPQVKYVWSVNLDIASAVIALCDLSGNVILKKKMDVPKEKGQFAEEAGNVILAETENLDPEVKERIAAIGVGVPGLVNREEGIWDNEIPVVSVLEKMTGLPCVLENNINAFAEAEIMFGTGRERDNLLIVKWGPGVGSAVVVDREVYTGRHGRTAEIGHYIVKKNGRKCWCGRHGCLETLVSAEALKELMDLKDEDVLGAYERLDDRGKAKVDEAMDAFACAIVNSCTILAPNRIILSGPFFREEKVRQMTVDACASYDPKIAEIRIVYTSLSDREDYIGPAACVIRRSVFAGL